MIKFKYARALVFLFSSIATINLYAANKNSCAQYANNKCYYNSSKAIEYATDQVKKSSTDINKNPEHWNSYFVDYTYNGGNCTNFVSQSILAGLVGSRYPSKIYPNTEKFAADFFSGSILSWAYLYKYNGYVTSAWKGANDLYRYARDNSQTYKGLHFSFITKDSSTTQLEFAKIQTGDIVFADWESDGVIDHSMIITKKLSNSYSGIKVSYQNSVGYDAQLNNSLSNFNKPKITFYVYRPTDYSDYGY